MSRLALLIPGLLAASLLACGPVEFRISKAQGARPLNGTLIAQIDPSSTPPFKCGDVITAEDDVQVYTVTTRLVSGGCEFTFDQDVEIIAREDYDEIKEFREAVHFVNRVEIAVFRLDFFDDQGNHLELDTHIRDLELWIDGEQVLSSDDVRGRLPHNVTLSGSALAAVKNAVKNRAACSVKVLARVVLLDAETQTGVRCEYESQPTYVLSTSEI